MTPKRVRTVEGSCWACKDRRVLCDLQRPQCSRCSSEDHPCEYGKLRLRWCNGVAARGRFAGQNVPVSSRGDDDGGGDDSLVSEGGKKRLLLQKEKRYRRSVDVQVSPLLSSQSMTFSPSSSLGFVSEKNGLYDAGYEQDEDVDDDDEEEEEEEEYRDGQETDYQQQMECKGSFELLTMPAFITADHLMLYFEKIVIDRFNLAAQPFTVDLGSVYQQPALRYSATAVANAHQQLSYCPQRRDTFLSKRTARLKAIHNFRTQLQSPTQTPRSPHQTLRRSPLPLDLFIANVLLCILDGVVDPNDENAACQVHYRGGRAILSQLKIPQRILLQQRRGLPALMLSCFATMDLTYSLLSGAEQFFQHTAWAYFAGSDGWWGVLRPGDPFLGIMRILSRLAQMGHVVRSGVDASIFEEELESLEASLRGFPNPSSSSSSSSFPSSTHSFGTSDSSSFLLSSYHEQSCSNLDDKSHPQQQSLLAPYLLAPMISTTYQLDDDQSWAIFCNAYRLTGLIYIYRVFRGLNPLHPLIQQATSYGLRAICEPRLRGKLAHCLLFPGLVIGAHCRTPAQQKANLAAMRSTAAFLSFGSLSVMENFLHELWRRNLAEESGSESWWECFQSISVQTFLF